MARTKRADATPDVEIDFDDEDAAVDSALKISTVEFKDDEGDKIEEDSQGVLAAADMSRMLSRTLSVPSSTGLTLIRFLIIRLVEESWFCCDD